MTYSDDAGWWPRDVSRTAPYDLVDGEPTERLTHLVPVDGRLVDTWSEPVLGTRWQPYADRFDRELSVGRPPPPPPPPPAHERALRWLDDVCGGRPAVLALGTEPLEELRDLPEASTRPEQHRLAVVAELLDGVAAVRMDPEGAHALRSALLAVWAADPTVVLHATTAEQAAGAIAWVVAKANGLTHPHGTLRVRDLQEGLGLRSSPGTHGRTVERALVGFREPAPAHWRPSALPQLLPLGHPELLLGSVREQLLRVRDQALRVAA